MRAIALIHTALQTVKVYRQGHTLATTIAECGVFATEAPPSLSTIEVNGQVKKIPGREIKPNHIESGLIGQNSPNKPDSR